jgi:hypothetical protein
MDAMLSAANVRIDPQSATPCPTRHGQSQPDARSFFGTPPITTTSKVSLRIDHILVHYLKEWLFKMSMDK